MLIARFPTGTVFTSTPGVEAEGVYAGSVPNVSAQAVYLRPGVWKGHVENTIDERGNRVPNTPDLTTCGVDTVEISNNGQFTLANGKYVAATNTFYTMSPWLNKNIQFWTYVANDAKVVYGYQSDDATPTPTEPVKPTPSTGSETAAWAAAAVKKFVQDTTFKEMLTYLLLIAVVYGLLTGKIDLSTFSLP